MSGPRSTPTPPRPPRTTMAAVLALLPLCAAALACGGGDPGAADAAVTAAPESAAGPASEPAAGGAAAETSGPGVPLARILVRASDRGPGGELAVLDELRSPPRADTATVRNRHDPALTDTVVTLRWDGLALAVYRVSASGKEILQRVTVESNAYDTGLGFAVGAPRADVVAAMGEPAGTEGGTLVWRLPEGERDPTPTRLEVAFDGGVVTSIAWDYYVD